jgi:hypothetical protein
MNTRKIPCKCGSCSTTPQGFLLLSKYLHSKHQKQVTLKFNEVNSKKVQDIISKTVHKYVDYANTLLPVQNLELFPNLSMDQENPRLASILSPQGLVNLKYLRFEQWYDDCIPPLQEAGKLDTNVTEKVGLIIENIFGLYSRVVMQVFAFVERSPPMNLIKTEKSIISSLEYLEWEISAGIRSYKFPLPLHFLQERSFDSLRISQETQLSLESPSTPYLGLDPHSNFNVSTIHQLRWVRAMLQQINSECQQIASTKRISELKEGLEEYLENVLAHVKGEKFRQDNPYLELCTLARSMSVHSEIIYTLIMHF